MNKFEFHNLLAWTDRSVDPLTLVLNREHLQLTIKTLGYLNTLV